MAEIAPEQTFETVAEIAELYLGNILYALELTSASLEQASKAPDAAFYRGIARKLAEAHGGAKRRAVGEAAGAAVVSAQSGE